MTRGEFLDLLARLRCAPVGRAGLRAPHKPLLLLGLFGRFAAVRNAGAWGLTVGTAAVTGQLMPGGSFRDQVNMALQLTMSTS